MPSRKLSKSQETTTAVLRHWHEALPDDRLAHLLKDAWRGLTRAFQTRLSEHAVLFGHWVFLRILWERDGLTQTELSREAGLMIPTTFSALKTMERLGYIYRERRAGSRKNVYIYLTPKARALKEELVPLAEEVNAIAVIGVTSSDVAATRRTLLAMIENLAQDELALQKMERKFPSTRDLVHVVANVRERPPSGPKTLAKGRRAQPTAKNLGQRNGRVRTAESSPDRDMTPAKRKAAPLPIRRELRKRPPPS